MLYHHLFKKFSKKMNVKAGLIGGGNYGTAIVTQSIFNRYLSISAVADINIEKAKKAFLMANIPDSNIIVCGNASEANEVIRRGKYVVTENPEILFNLDIDVIAEATGIPEAGAYHARLALEKNKHLVMINKQTDSVIGPILHSMFTKKGLVYSPVDGDQPALLMQMVEWARMIGLEVISAGKARDGEFIYDEITRTVTHPADETKNIPHPAVVRISEEDAKYLEFIPQGKSDEYCRKRKEILRGLPQAGEYDFCEIVMMANATGLDPDMGELHQVPLRVNEIPVAYCSEKNGGLFQKEGTLDMITCLRRKEEASMGGGVYIVVRSNNAYSQKVLTTKGLIGNYDNSAAVICRPYHLCGVESSTSLMCAGMLGIDTGAAEYVHRYDLVRKASRDLSAGTLCGNDRDTNFESLIVPASKKSGGSPVPAHMINGNRLKADVRKGTVITYDMIQEPEHSALWDLREIQEGYFLIQNV